MMLLYTTSYNELIIFISYYMFHDRNLYRYNHKHIYFCSGIDSFLLIINTVSLNMKHYLFLHINHQLFQVYNHHKGKSTVFFIFFSPHFHFSC